MQREAEKLNEGNDQTGKADEHGDSANEHAEVPAHGADQSLGMTGFRLGIQALVVGIDLGIQALVVGIDLGIQFLEVVVNLGIQLLEVGGGIVMDILDLAVYAGEFVEYFFTKRQRKKGVGDT